MTPPGEVDPMVLDLFRTKEVELLEVGARCQKIRSEPYDASPDGSPGTVVGVMGPVELDGVRLWGYFVDWDHERGRIAGGRFVMGHRVKFHAEDADSEIDGLSRLS